GSRCRAVPGSQEIAIRAEDLHARSQAIDDLQVAFVVDGDARRSLELAVTSAASPEAGNDVAVQIEHLDPVVPPIDHIDKIAHNFDIGRTAELARPIALLAPGRQVLAGAREDLHAVIARIGDVDAIPSDGNTLRRAKLAIALPGTTPFGLNGAIVQVQHDDPVVAALDDVDEPVVVHRNGHRAGERRAIRAWRLDHPHEISIGIEDLDAAVPGIGDDDRVV